MKRVFVASVVLAWSVVTGCAAPRGLERYEFVEHHMGCAARIVLYAASAEEARGAAGAAFGVLGRVDAELSDYRVDGELARVEREARVGTAREIGAELAECLERAIAWSRRTDGAFDVTIGPVVRSWRAARASGRMPGEAELDAARACVGWEKVRLDVERRTLAFQMPGMRLDFGGIGPGFGADRALAEIVRSGHRTALVDVGGDLALGDAPPGERGWRVRAMAGEGADGETLVLANCGVSTSGASEQFVEIGGVRYSHIVDPRTGLGLTHHVRTTVVARDATDADALATAISVLGIGRGIELAEGIEGVEARVEEVEGDAVRGRETRGYSAIRSQSISSPIR